MSQIQYIKELKKAIRILEKLKKVSDLERQLNNKKFSLNRKMKKDKKTMRYFILFAFLLFSVELPDIKRKLSKPIR